MDFKKLKIKGLVNLLFGIYFKLTDKKILQDAVYVVLSIKIKDPKQIQCFII